MLINDNVNFKFYFILRNMQLTKHKYLKSAKMHSAIK